ncbi:TAXI family TRAP transporter solute-binding subunit [Myxococcota bacterium]|nr:TAXI family TRAP transporter solute-binding subunit [Myxococcota bacterium]
MKPQGNRDWLKLVGLAVLLVGSGFWFASRFVSPAPPHQITLATGQAGGAYSLFAHQYQAALAKFEIDLEILYTQGSVENLAMLESGRADVAMVQSGVVLDAQREALRGLGSIFLEPLWVFLPAESTVHFLTDLAGQRIQVGPAGSGTRTLTVEILALNDIGADQATFLSDPSDEAAQSLRRGEADAVFLVGSVDSPVVRTLIEREDVRLLDMTRAEAYTRLDRSLSKVNLPEGAISLSRNFPAKSKTLLSTAAELVVGPSFHPALVDLLLQTSAQIHGGGDLFAEPGEFPTPRWVDVPLDSDAERYFEYGPPLLQRYLPFWAATQIDRLKVMLIPLIALLLPLVRIFPPTYRWRVRSRIYRWYKELRLAEPGGVESLTREDLLSCLKEVERIDTEVTKVHTPTSYARELYSLRLHIDFVRGEIEAALRSKEDRG